MTPIDLIHQCASDLAPVTIAAIVQQESGGNPFLLHDNTTKKSWRLNNADESTKLARALIQAGHSVDIGLAQINSKNLSALGLKIDDALDPCTNLLAAQSILKTAWEQSGHDLRGALAAYNTGKTTSSVGAHYSAEVFAKAGIKVPEIPGGKMASWVTQNPARIPTTLPPIRAVVTWTPAASPLQPRTDVLLPKAATDLSITIPAP
ncbi:lytic transglycosylase domain-containing protein [Ferrovum myxofaciens]|uniref:lytic transglycosylase domain-containing protein n=1 Tax=Ferrovum myxofaciens TaxID=416213 RepID=UPI0005517D60|nr:lytic transglycosylase domain-containing protein [Ferrovum myxofaciens]